MYNETGSKIKSWATCSVIFEIFLFIFIGFISFFILFTANELSELGVYLCIGCIVVSIFRIITIWGKYLLLAGFGELIENTAETTSEVSEIKKIIIDSRSKENIGESKTIEERSEEELIKFQLLQDCFEKGLIAKEEFEKKMQEIRK